MTAEQVLVPVRRGGRAAVLRWKVPGKIPARRIEREEVMRWRALASGAMMAAPQSLVALASILTPPVPLAQAWMLMAAWRHEQAPGCPAPRIVAWAPCAAGLDAVFAWSTAGDCPGPAAPLPALVLQQAEVADTTPYPVPEPLGPGRGREAALAKDTRRRVDKRRRHNPHRTAASTPIPRPAVPLVEAVVPPPPVEHVPLREVVEIAPSDGALPAWLQPRITFVVTSKTRHTCVDTHD